MNKHVEREVERMPKLRLDTIDDLCADAGVRVDTENGLLLIEFKPDGQVLPYVLRLGTMTEGKLERQLMPIFNAIVRARVELANKTMQEEREKRIQDAKE